MNATNFITLHAQGRHWANCCLKKFHRLNHLMSWRGLAPSVKSLSKHGHRPHTVAIYVQHMKLWVGFIVLCMMSVWLQHNVTLQRCMQLGGGESPQLKPWTHRGHTLLYIVNNHHYDTLKSAQRNALHNQQHIIQVS